MIYYTYNNELITAQNIKRAKLSASDVTIISEEDANKYFLQVAEGFRKVPGKLELEEVPVDTEALEAKAKALRDSAVDFDIELGDTGLMYQVDKAAIDSIQEVRLAVSEEILPEEYSISWRLSDNSWRDTTVRELNSLLVSRMIRKQDIWDKFNTWSLGDKTEEFTL